MSRTVRRVRGLKARYTEGRNTTEAKHYCNCHYCVGVDKMKLVEKIAKKELKQQLKEYNTTG